MTASDGRLIIAVPVYTATLLLSAFLLFLIQPMFGKMVLPLLGGVPSVWITAMLFFQIVLLAGYCYAHTLARFLSVRAQSVVHLALIVLFIWVLPISVADSSGPAISADPALWQLGLMLITIGGPFFVLSGSAPLLQHWFSRTGHKDAEDPYFLYAASNLGSMTALLVYPFVLEPMLDTPDQAHLWAAGYGIFGLLVFASVLSGRRFGHTEPASDVKPDIEVRVTGGQRTLWVLLAFAPSSLMLGVTTFITTDLASVPLLWIVPLLLYVGTFVIAFSRQPLIALSATRHLQFWLLLALLCLQLFFSSSPLLFQIAFHLALFFFTALLCHQELVQTRPTAQHLTQFYLFLSLGGALGGVFNALIVPHLFVRPIEYALVLAFAVFLRFASDPDTGLVKSVARMREHELSAIPFLRRYGPVAAISAVAAATYLMGLTMWTTVVFALIVLGLMPGLAGRRWGFGICTAAILMLHPPASFSALDPTRSLLYQERNFFGTVRVVDIPAANLRALIHGTTIHGAQSLDPAQARVPLSYYSARSPLRDAFDLAEAMAFPQRIAALGLGVGTVACHRAQGRHFDFFEIDPTVIRVAEDPRLFTFLSACGSDYDIFLGDGRLRIGDQPDASYDIIFLDVFSSDTIPVHVVTLEALRLYKTKLKKSGFIVINISNNHMDLKPVLQAAADHLDMVLLTEKTPGHVVHDARIMVTPAEFALLSNQQWHLEELRNKGWTEVESDQNFRPWTDQYSNLLSVLQPLLD